MSHLKRLVLDSFGCSVNFLFLVFGMAQSTEDGLNESSWIDLNLYGLEMNTKQREQADK